MINNPPGLVSPTSQVLLSLGKVQNVGVGLLLGAKPASQRSLPNVFCLLPAVLVFMMSDLNHCLRSSSHVEQTQFWKLKVRILMNLKTNFNPPIQTLQDELQ